MRLVAQSTRALLPLVCKYGISRLAIAAKEGLSMW